MLPHLLDGRRRLATAAGILGYQVLRRSRSTRLCAVRAQRYTVALTGMVTGGFVSSVVAASAAMLWLQPARDWFDGINRPKAEARAVPAAPPVLGTPPATGVAWPSEYAAMQTRPTAVVWSCGLTWVFSGSPRSAWSPAGSRSRWIRTS